jgi:hypothetical protein
VLTIAYDNIEFGFAKVEKATNYKASWTIICHNFIATGSSMF